MQDFLPIFVGMLLIAAIFWGWQTIRKLYTRVTVYEYQHSLHFNKGRFVGTLSPGTHRLRTAHTSIQTVDARRQILTVPGQEILSLDGVGLKLSVLLDYQVTEPKIAVLEHDNYTASLYALVQKEVRTLISATPIENILEARHEMESQLAERVKSEGEALGLTINDVSLKDIMFPGALRESFSQVARAKQEGLAALERARGETAALRNLANSAKMMDSNPNLYRLRLLQSINEASSIVLHVDSDGSANSDSQTKGGV